MDIRLQGKLPLSIKGIKSVEIRDAIRASERLPIKEDTPSLLSEMIIKCWDGNPKQRPDFNSLAKKLETDIVNIHLASPPIFQSTTLMISNNQATLDFGDAPFTDGVDASLLNNDPSPKIKPDAQPAVVSPMTQNLATTDKVIVEDAKLPLPKRINFQALSKKKKLLFLSGCILILVIIVVIILAFTVFSTNGTDFSETSESSTSSITTTTTKTTSLAAQAVPTNHYCYSNYKNSTVSTFAGASGLSGSTDGAALSARFDYPFGIAIISEGNIIISEFNNRRLRLINATSKQVSTVNIGSGPYANVDRLFGSPTQLAINANGIIFIPVSTTASSAILKLEGNTLTLVAGNTISVGSVDGGIGTSRLSLYPNLLANGDDVVVFDVFNHKIKVLKSDNVLSNLAGDTYGDQDGILTIAQFSHPNSGAFDSRGNLLVTEYLNNAIRKITPEGIVSTFIKNSTLLPAPKGIIVDPCDNVIIISKQDGSGMITLFSPSGEPRVLVGAGGSSGLVNGPGATARFSYIDNLVQDKQGNIYIPDQRNHVIRKISFS